MKYQRIYEEYPETKRASLVFYYFTSSEWFDISGMVTEHEWSGDINAACEEFTLTIHNKQGDKRAIRFEEGNMIKVSLVSEGKESELFRGVLVKRNMNGTGAETLTAYDFNWYLQQNEVTATFTNKRADQIIAALAKRAGVSVGYLANTGHVFKGELVFVDKTIWEIIQTVLTETYIKTKKRYKVRNEAGKLALREVTLSTQRKLIERGRNMLSISREISMENVKTQVVATGKDEQVGPSSVKLDESAKKKYGTLTIIEHYSDIENKSILDNRAKDLLNVLKKPTDHVSVEGLADYFVSAGDMIEVYDSLTEVNRYYFVTSHSHKGGNPGTMSLDLAESYNPEEVRYEKPSEPETEESSGAVDLTQPVSNVTYESGWEATAYAWRLGGINGNPQVNGVTASGTKVLEGRTIAVDPKVIPYGSIVLIEVPSLSKYSGLYLAEDTGGAIKNKRIDVAVLANEAKTFGRRQVRVSVLEKGTGKADARNKANNWANIEKQWMQKLSGNTSSNPSPGVSSKRQAVVNGARSYIGKLTYQWGGKNIPSGKGDCSGFSNYIYRKYAGINIGDGTMSQVTKGKKIDMNSAQAGDLVFFQGTNSSRGATTVSHVGVVTRPGWCVSLGNSGCREHGYLKSNDSYWGSKFQQIRRVLG